MPVIAIRWWAAAGLLAVASVQAGCGSDDPPAAAAQATRSATAAPRTSVPRDVSGSWERKVSAREWRRAGGGFPPGTWRFDVDAKGSVDVYLPGTTSADFCTRF